MIRLSNYRLTTRGKVVVTLLLAIVVMSILPWLPKEEKPESPDSSDQSGAPHETAQGETPGSSTSGVAEKYEQGEKRPQDPSEEQPPEPVVSNPLPDFEERKTILYFGPDDESLLAPAIAHLETFLGEMREVPWKVRIDSHINGYPDYNDSAFGEELSRRRGEVVAQYLVDAGVNEERLVLYSHGSAEPVHEEATVEELAKNRRVELRFVRQTVDKVEE
jgi:outer membrane protein OmpA-like peptidoglycan-associated protein